MMPMHATPQSGNPTSLVYAPARIPSRWIEYAYYFAVIYSVTADVLGISVSMLAGGMILLLSVTCMLQLRSCAWKVYAPIALLIACATSFCLVQIVIHGLSITDGDIRAFIIWILGLIIVHSLCLRRGFLHRFIVVLLVLGAITVPYLAFNPGEVERARVGIQVGILSHPGGLAEWFGY